MQQILTDKTARAVASFVLLVSLAAIFMQRPGPQPTETVIPTETTVVAAAATATATMKVTPGEIEDPSGRALDHLFAAFERAERGGGHAVISHYGDSPITGDGITSTVRRRLQARFGDAGHGFVLPVKPWGWYAHDGIEHLSMRGWAADPMFISRGDLRYGFGGASLASRAANAETTIASTFKNGGAFDVYYLAQPGGGALTIEIDGERRETISTAHDAVRSAFHRLEAGAGRRELTIRAAGDGPVRFFGVAIENEASGIVYDSLGVNGAFIGLLANFLDADHWAEQLRHRQPDLIVIGYGANESQFENLPMDRYERDTREAVRRIRAALPQASILFFGPMDRGERGGGGATVTRPMIPKLVAYQRRLAAETGCAFFDTFTAMGGEGTVGRWMAARPRLMGGDYTHPTVQGSEIVGTLFSDALLRAYDNRRAAGALTLSTR